MYIFLKFFEKQLKRSLLLGVIFTTLLSAQEKKSIPKIEKVYIHTDRTCYALGESLWYKAYSVFAYNNLLYSDSNVLYVELISPKSKIIARNKTLLEDGLGHGDFKLTDSLGVKPGIYQIRAYTNYSRNFGNDFVFKKEIEIIDVFEKAKAKAKETKAVASKPVANKTTDVSQYTFNVQFFPEGGSLINNVQSIVAFKAVDTNGNPVEVEGSIVDSNGEMVTFFGSLHDGMGKFQLKPIKGKQYHAVITSKGKEIEVPLPKVNEHGFVLQTNYISDKVYVTVRTNKETLSKQPNSPLVLICATRGVTYFEEIFQLSELAVSYELPKADFPEGISQVTLYDANLLPHSERLLYVEKENDVIVALTTDKKTYLPDENVTVNISSKTKSGNAVAASYSLSCWDLNGATNNENYGTNISSYFLMESDIRGTVNNPGYYFDHSNTKRLEHLDLLLLTQGWRDFLWKTLPKVNDSLAFKAEKGLIISGRVKSLFGDKPKENYNVSLTLFSKSGMNGFRTVTDSDGRFQFENLAFLGKASMYLNAKNDKLKSSGMLELDDLNQSPMPVDYKEINTFYSDPELSTIEESIYKKYIMNGVSPENILDEIEIIAKKKNYISQYGLTDFSYYSEEDESQFIDMYQLIQSTIPGVVVDNINKSISFPRFSGAAMIVINDVPSMSMDDLDFIQPSDVERIDVFKGGATNMFGSDGVNGVLAIYLKKAGPITNDKKVFHSISEKIEGFYDARIFYSPDPNTPSIERDNTTAVRNTLYWNPYMHPDKTGVSQATYYNSEVETTVKVTLEGITATGIPVVVNTSYRIEN